MSNSEHYVDFLIEMSFKATILKSNYDLFTLKKIICNKYNNQIAEYFRQITKNNKNFFSPLTLCFFEALSQAKYLSTIDKTAIIKSKETSVRAILYYYLVNFRIFFLFYIIYYYIKKDDLQTDAQAFFQNNFDFIIKLGKDYNDLIDAIADCFINKEELSEKEFIEKFLLNIKNKEEPIGIINKFISTFIKTDWNIFLNKALDNIKKQFKNNEILEETEKQNLLKIFIEKITSADNKIKEKTSEIENITNKIIEKKHNKIFIIPYFLSPNGYYSSQTNNTKEVERLNYAYIKYSRDIFDETSKYSTTHLGIISNFLYLIVLEKLLSIPSVAKNPVFTAFARKNQMIDFFMFYTENTNDDLVKKDDEIFKSIHNSEYNIIPNKNISYVNNGRFFYENFMTDYLKKVILSKEDVFKDILEDTFRQMVEQQQNNIAPNIRDFAKSIVNNLKRELHKDFIPLDYNLLQTGSYSSDLIQIFNNINKSRDFKNNYEILIKDMSKMILKCFGERKWQTLNEK